MKQKAQELGAGIVGITEMEPNDLYGDMELKHKYAICIGIPMRREETLHVPHERSGLEVQRIYGEVARVAVELAEHIRAMGWPAHAYGGPRSTEALQIPMAVRAGSRPWPAFHDRRSGYNRKNPEPCSGWPIARYATGYWSSLARCRRNGYSAVRADARQEYWFFCSSVGSLHSRG